MGLDMYLTKKTYVGAKYDHRKEKLKNFKIEWPEKSIKRERISYIMEEVGCWRKANAIHGWFVANVQDGIDNCGEYYVSREQLEELGAECQRALSFKNPKGLPPQSGFFFGSTDVDEYYWQDLKDTIDIIKAVLSEPMNEYLYYQSSW